MDEINWALAIAGMLLGVVNAAGFGLALRGIRAGHGLGAQVTAAICGVGMLAGTLMLLAGLSGG